MQFFTEDIIKLIIATFIGGLIGAEREYYNKSAGLRTIILICVGSCLFTILSIQIGGSNSTDRIAANIVTGIGFLGAGAIFREENRIKGLTTASTIWIASALGMCIGIGYYILAGFTVILTLTVLLLFKKLQRYLDKADLIREYQIACDFDPKALQRLEAAFRTCGLKANCIRQTRRQHTIDCTWNARGTDKEHQHLTEKMLLVIDRKGGGRSKSNGLQYS